ncbi:hypothetical protein LTR53_001390 [Teratosphaeriaceae sp. CCFEE 6253]|nr:hypothetical protein LTR53_001390 [Teratosphaeriaceae sp. CCFEE 6253]
MFHTCGSPADADFTSQIANTYNYSRTEWQADIAAAQQIGIDGFGPFAIDMCKANGSIALNWAPPDCSTGQHALDWYPLRIDDAFAVAAGTGFKLIHSFDMSYTAASCTYPWNATYMASMITKYASNPAAYLWNGDMLVSTYAGEGYGNSFFQSLKSTVAAQGVNISLAPALTGYSNTAQNTDPNTVAQGMLNDYTSIDGYLNCVLLKV